MSRLRRWTLVLGLCLVFASLAAGAARVTQLLHGELEYEGSWETLAARATKPGATRVSVRLAEVALRAGEDATFEVCAQSDLAAPTLQGALAFVVWRRDAQKLELKVPLDPAHQQRVRRAQGRSCLTLGGGRIGVTDRYALDVVWPSGQLTSELAQLSVRPRVLGKRPLGLREGLLVVTAALGAVISLLSAFATDTPRATGDARPRPHAALWALAFGSVGAILFQLLLRVPVPLAASGIIRGVLVGAVEVALAWLGARLCFAEARPGLRLFAPARPTLWMFSAIGVAAVLRVASHYCLRFVPSTGEAPIETYIAWPSGALSFALIGMAAPLAEELFFRGFVYGALRSINTASACLGSFALFVLAHVQQVWGGWGALMSLVVTGAVLTALRALSGSTLLCALAHVLFNLSLWSASFRG